MERIFQQAKFDEKLDDKKCLDVCGKCAIKIYNGKTTLRKEIQ